MEGIIIKKFGFVLVFVIIFSAFPLSASALSESSASSVVINADTLEIIYEKDAYSRRSMASTTKIMTGLILAESGRLTETVVCSKRAVSVEGSSMGLRAGDKITAQDLLYGLMLMSGNDAANVIAEFIAGSNEKFAELMNKRSKELGLSDTNFITPSGLDDAEHYTTAYDLAKLTAYALKNNYFYDACSKSQVSVSFGNPPVKYTISNHNRLLKEYEGCVGVKTGFTKKSGRCLVSAAERDGKRIIAVTLKDPDDWRDHKELLDYGFEMLTTATFKCENTITVPIVNADSVCKIFFDDIEVSVLEQNIDKLSLKITKPDYIFSPIEEGDTVGRAEVCFNGDVVAVTKLYVINGVLPTEYKKPSAKERIFLVFRNMIKTF